MALSAPEHRQFQNMEREITRLWDMFPKNAKATSFKGHVHDVSGGTGEHSHTHGALTSVTANQHHNASHTVASHSDTTATGAELETLTDGSATALHSHSVDTKMLVYIPLFDDHDPGFVFTPA